MTRKELMTGSPFHSKDTINNNYEWKFVPLYDGETNVINETRGLLHLHGSTLQAYCFDINDESFNFSLTIFETQLNTKVYFKNLTCEKAKSTVEEKIYLTLNI